MNEMNEIEQDMLNSAANVFVNDAQVHGSPNFRTHTVLVGDETWEITVRRSEGKTPDQHIHALESQLAEVTAQRDGLRALVEQVEWLGGEVPTPLEWTWCPWCHYRFQEGHAPDCPRQAALARCEED